MPSWDADRYLSFEDDRTRPARDLLARVPDVGPSYVVDVGCGPGNSTRLLVERWPEAVVVGIDSSPEMLAKARGDLPGAEFVEADLRDWTPPRQVDVVFSNATLQWVDDHPSILARLVSWLAPGGVMAVQMPANFDAPSHVSMRQVAARSRWRSRLEGALREAPVAAPQDYYEWLAPFGQVDIWRTEYFHTLHGDDPVFDWVSGTGLRPVLDRLDDGDAAAFSAEYSEELRKAYPRRADGTTLFPFRRIFLVLTTAP
jgi:trans-aconitate 2-methyltransferase